MRPSTSIVLRPNTSTGTPFNVSVSSAAGNVGNKLAKKAEKITEAEGRVERKSTEEGKELLCAIRAKKKYYEKSEFLQGA